MPDDRVLPHFRRKRPVFGSKPANFSSPMHFFGIASSKSTGFASKNGTLRTRHLFGQGLNSCNRTFLPGWKYRQYQARFGHFQNRSIADKEERAVYLSDPSCKITIETSLRFSVERKTGECVASPALLNCHRLNRRIHKTSSGSWNTSNTVDRMILVRIGPGELPMETA